VLVWSGISAHRQAAALPSNAPGAANGSRPSMKLPDAPLSLEGAPQEGNSKASVAIIEFSDFQCPFCGAFARDTLPQLKNKYLRTGKALLAFRHMPLTNIHAFAEKAGASAECANQQGKFWAMHDELFHSQQSLEAASLRRLAARARLDLSQYDRCMAESDSKRVSDDTVVAKALGISGTPTFLIGRVEKDGRVKVLNVLTGSQPLTQFDAAIAAATAVQVQARAQQP
jgi:protein-disulfide isomerase